MGQAATMFSSVLERERQAAITADVDALAKLQDEKRAALTALHSDEELTEDEMASLRARAMANVQLIRHLTVCLQGMVAPEAPTYTAGGARPVGAMSRSWGRL